MTPALPALLAILLACASGEVCPADPGEAAGELLAENWTDVLGDATEREVEVFHDYESMNAWWQASQYTEPAPQVDFDSRQVVGYVATYNDVSGGVGSHLEGVYWNSSLELRMTAHIGYDCGHGHVNNGLLRWFMWVTDIGGVDVCGPPECDEQDSEGSEGP